MMSTSKHYFERAVLLVFIIGVCLGLASIVETRDTDVANSDSIDPLAKDLTDFFQNLVRKRRQLTPRKDENKLGFTAEEKLAMLTVHNSHRSLVTPTAADMIELRWDADIEAFAQDWANTCTPQHNSNRNLKGFFNMGENIWYHNNRFGEALAVNAWWNEKDHYTFATKVCAPGKKCGHYITAAWAKSEYLGCGVKRCPVLLESRPDLKFYLIVCNYSDYFLSDTRPYVEGETCSNCPAKYPKCRYNLCVTQSMLDNCEGYNGTALYMSETRTNSVTDTMNCPAFVVDPGQPTTTTPKATTPKATTPKATTPKATTPKATTPKATTPKATTPKATTPKATTPKATTPKATTPKATTPITTSPNNQDSTTVGNADSTTKGATNTIAYSSFTLVICLTVLSVFAL